MNAYYPQITTSASMLDSIVKIEELSTTLQSYERVSVAITDRKLYGLLPFYKEMKRHNIHAVFGLTVKMVVSDATDLPYILYAKNEKGYHHLIKISSAVSLREQEDLPLNWLNGYKEGLQLMIPLANLDVSEECESAILQVANLFDEGIYLGMERIHGVPSEQESYWIAFAQEHQLKIAMTHEVRFINEDDVEAFEAAQSIKEGIPISERRALTAREKGLFLPTTENLQNWFEDQPDWLIHTEELLSSCDVTLTYEEHHMPKFPVSEGQTAQAVLLEQCLKGLEHRGLIGEEHYENRLKYELSIINQMGYADYFLIVADYIEFARSQRILTGPGRGSSASSLVAYCLKITNVDPIKYDLLFERFLNPDRITLPDIDVDFADVKRQAVIDYVVEKYGMQYTSQIITFGTLSAKAVARDVARVLGFTMDDLKVISSLIPSKPGTTLSMTLSTLNQWIGEDPLKQKWLEIALKLEGLHRNASTHAAGVVLSPKPLPDIVPIEKGSEQIYITQWPMQEVEEIGLLKMDFLGLKNLSILDHIRYLIYFNQKKMLDFEKIPLHDENTFRLLQNGDTAGVFQLESDGMRKALVQIQPTSFQDLVAINALYRPGPMEFIPVYSRRKHGLEQVQLPHPDLAPILDETFGVIVYQEQIMRIASVFAGFSLGEADLLRRAVSKKKRELLDSERLHFVQGAINKGYNEQVANEIYDLIVRFANYGFPKSHAVAYSLITYQMAYLKANFPHYFYAALLSSAIGNKEKHSQLLQEVRSKGIEILPPSILKSGKSYRVEGNCIRYALGAIRGIPQTFLNKLQALRKNGDSEWTSIFEMALAFTGTHFKRQTMEALIKAGAVDSFGRDRAQLIETISAAEKLAKLYAPNEETTLFYDTNIYGVPKHASVENMTEKEKLEGEKEVLGFYVSKHPVENLKEKYHFNGISLNRVSSIKIGARINALAQVQNIKVIRTKKGEQMAFLQLEDETSSISATIFPQVFEKYIDDIVEEQFIKVEAKVESRNNAPQLIIQQLSVIPKE